MDEELRDALREEGAAADGAARHGSVSSAAAPADLEMRRRNLESWAPAPCALCGSAPGVVTGAGGRLLCDDCERGGREP